jgi:putative transcriptional regulator
MEVRDPAKIKRWRVQRHYSQRDLAFLTRRSQAAIWQIENGKLRNIEEDFALAIAARLDVPWEDLFEAHEHVTLPQVTNESHPIRHVPAVA